MRVAEADAVHDEVLAAEDDRGVDIGDNDVDAVRIVLQRALAAAAAEGLSAPAVERLSAAVLGDLFDVFRLRMCADPPVRLPPIQVRLVPGARPVRQPARRYSAEDSAFMAATMERLESMGYVFKNSSAVWSSPAFPVRKPHVSPTTPLLDRMRLCVDLRAVNRLTEPMALPLPRMETVVERLGGQLYLGSVDILSSFWQCELAEECQEWFTIPW